MLAVFVGAMILWITEAVPNYLTSLILIIALVLTNVISETDAYHQLGHRVMWLNILSFVLASMLVKTQVAKRFALWLIVRFGKNASSDLPQLHRHQRRALGVHLGHHRQGRHPVADLHGDRGGLRRRERFRTETTSAGTSFSRTCSRSTSRPVDSSPDPAPISWPAC